MSQSVRERVSDRGKQWLDSGPINKSWTHLINIYDMFGNWSISARDLSSSKLWISKKYTLFHFLWKTTSFTHLTQFYIPSQNELIWKTPFFTFSILASGKTVRLWTIFLELEYFCKYTHNKMSNQESEDVLYWRLGKLDCNATMGNEQLGILHHPQNRSFGNTEESTFELLAIGHHEYWTAA